MLNSATPDFAILVFAKLRYAVTGCFLATLDLTRPYHARPHYALLRCTQLRFVWDIVFAILCFATLSSASHYSALLNFIKTVFILSRLLCIFRNKLCKFRFRIEVLRHLLHSKSQICSTEFRHKRVQTPATTQELSFLQRLL